MPVAWPPPTAPAWPPASYPGLEFSDIDTAVAFADEVGWTTRNATTAEQRAYFRDARCDEGHAVTGIILVTRDGTGYPFARCNGPAGSRLFLVLWPPYSWNAT